MGNHNNPLELFKNSASSLYYSALSEVKAFRVRIGLTIRLKF